MITALLFVGTIGKGWERVDLKITPFCRRVAVCIYIYYGSGGLGYSSKKGNCHRSVQSSCIYNNNILCRIYSRRDPKRLVFIIVVFVVVVVDVTTYNSRWGLWCAQNGQSTVRNEIKSGNPPSTCARLLLFIFFFFDRLFAYFSPRNNEKDLRSSKT